MKQRFCCLLVCFCLLCAVLCGCSPSFYGIKERTDEGDPSGYVQEILPNGQGTASSRMPATVYFRYLDQELLTPVNFDFLLSAQSSLEEMIVQRLIDGPDDPSLEFNSLINPETRIVQIKEQSGYLSIVLSAEFLQDYDDLGLTAADRRLAILSIVDSITELGQYSRVLVLVDKQGNGTGARLTGEEAGFSNLGSSYLEPLARDTSVLLTVEHAVEQALQALVKKEYASLTDWLAQTDLSGASLPDEDTLAADLGAAHSLVSFALLDGVSLSYDGQQATVLLDYTCTDASGQPVKFQSIPLRLIREKVWKVSYASLLAGLSQR